MRRYLNPGRIRQWSVWNGNDSSGTSSLSVSPQPKSLKAWKPSNSLEGRKGDPTGIGSEGYRRKPRSDLLLLSQVWARQGSFLQVAWYLRREGLRQGKNPISRRFGYLTIIPKFILRFGSESWPVVNHKSFQSRGICLENDRGCGGDWHFCDSKAADSRWWP